MLPAGQPRTIGEPAPVNTGTAIRRRIVEWNPDESGLSRWFAMVAHKARQVFSNSALPIVEPAPARGSINSLKGRLYGSVKEILHALTSAELVSLDKSWKLAVTFWATWRDLVRACTEREVEFSFLEKSSRKTLDTESASEHDCDEAIGLFIRDFTIGQLANMKSQLENFEAQLPWIKGEKYDAVWNFISDAKDHCHHSLFKFVPSLRRNSLSSFSIVCDTWKLSLKIEKEHRLPTPDEMSKLGQLLNSKLDNLGFDEQEMAQAEKCGAEFEETVMIARRNVREAVSNIKTIYGGCPPEVRQNVEVQLSVRAFILKAELLIGSAD
jgi:hypothetical protein